jgi:acylphosphatase
MVHYNISVKGLVQGVYYRQSTKRKAQDLKLNGFVKNMLDGSVYIEVEGPENLVYQFIDWCHIGSQRSKVNSVELETGSLKRFDNFQIKY